jgi:hypothetical protein
MNMKAARNKRYLLFGISGLLFLGLLFGFLYFLKQKAEPPPESISIVGPAEYINPDANPIHANIGVYVINVGNLDLTTGIYFMDFYLTILCDRPCQPDIDILNAAAAPEIEKQSADTQGDTVHTYRVRANLITNVYLDNFPFDEQTLTLSIGDKQANKDQLVFNEDPSFSGWDYGHLHVLGWFIRHQWNAVVTEDAYPNLGSLYSRFEFSIQVYKPWLSSFINNIFPVLIIVLVGFLAFLFSPEAAGERLTLTSSTLVALILFHINLNSAIPPLSSLTFADKFMIINYLAISISIAISAILLVLRDGKNLEAASKLNSWTRWIIPPLWALLLLAMTIWQFNSAEINAWLQR